MRAIYVPTMPSVSGGCGGGSLKKACLILKQLSPPARNITPIRMTENVFITWASHRQCLAGMMKPTMHFIKLRGTSAGKTVPFFGYPALIFQEGIGKRHLNILKQPSVIMPATQKRMWLKLRRYAKQNGMMMQ